MPVLAAKNAEELFETHLRFAAEFWTAFAGYEPTEIVNADETSLFFDMPPQLSWVAEGLLKSKISRSIQGGQQL
ncbi:unnamed protein product [Phytophthora lilii]|uniref:Unnamed protein product n=1 Tax=Phytophthora lilii TaxID=2077276 RepID=A0A9W6X3J2_9STRA|nr:unnamed protein product [Phytophthora lilii]